MLQSNIYSNGNFVSKQICFKTFLLVLVACAREKVPPGQILWMGNMPVHHLQKNEELSENQQVIREGMRFVGRLVKAEVSDESMPAFSSTGAVVITGGLSGIGYRMCEDLVEQGGLVLVFNIASIPPAI